ncbi:bifunctional UDP-sugar hydrolase/5'-nucleotidase [Lentisphaera profundi]|uniref:Bifunctional UDP-sugar hydrolase/5'-nucleotidase n=1 Tax=Lentisphaera profundi TaxID=1658616 RepID=A0ABY7VX02_9BACT|nr:bifunctional UDP-sugar hydrolase/5'-nucleotidase [Lentisphaera profundi]WDE98781.1 bifunctional UDP-sugar hydrolase/5'-nucleotidase [Lentisphaera profundi]
MPYIHSAFIMIFLSLFCHAEQSLLILQSTDIHSNVFAEDSNHKANWLRMSSKINELRTQQGRSNTLLIDCGDTIQGSLSASLTRGAAAIKMLNYQDYDAWIPGNHELDFGSARFLELCKQSTIPVLSANFEFIPKKAFHFKPYLTYKRANKKIIVIGMQASFLEYWSTGSQFSNCRVWSAKEALAQIMPNIIKEKADLIILALHQGIAFRDDRKVNEVLDIAKLYPEINLILGGHTHREHAAYLSRSGVFYTQAGAHTEHLAKIIVNFSKKNPLKISSELIKIDHNTPIDAKAQELMKNIHQDLKQHLAKPITTLSKDLRAAKIGLNCEITHLIGHAVINASDADIAIHGRLSSKSLKQGPIGERELFDIIPYENDLFTVKVSPSELLQIMQEQMSYYKSYSFNAPINFTYDQKNDTIILKTKDLHKDKLSLCINSRVAASGGNRFPVLKTIISQASAKLTELPIKTRDAVRNQLKMKLPTFEKTLILK